MDNGWIKLHRKFTEWGWYQKSEMVHLFLHLLLMANHEDGTWQGQKILRGQMITGRFKLNEKTGISEQTIRTCLQKLVDTGEITIKSTNKYSIITLVKYSDYQKDERKLTNNQPTTNQQLTTNNNNKKNKNILEEQAPQEDIVKVIDSFKEINPAYKKWYGNTNQRKAITRMIETHSLEKILRVVAILPKTNKIPYITNIQTPCQLEDKWSTLKAQLEKEKNKLSKVNKNTPNYVL